MTTDDNALTVIEDGAAALVELEPINRELVVRFADTLLGIHPGAQDVGKVGMRTVAQLALMTGANPLPGSNGIHCWKDKDGRICIAFGIGFWRGEAEKMGGLLWLDRPRPMTAEERETYGIPEGTYAAVARAALKREAFALRADARAFGEEMPLREALEQVARDGIGIAAPGEYAKKGRPLQWTADERAERDLLRKLCPVAQRARQVHTGGHGWHVSQFVRQVATLPGSYDIGAANADLFGDAAGEEEE